MIKIFLFSAILLLSHAAFSQNPLVKQWDYRYGGTDADQFNAMIKTIDNGILLGGSSTSQLNGDKTQNNWDSTCALSNCTGDYWIVKLDSLGIKVWDKRYGGIDNEYLNSMMQTKDGGYILGGWSNSSVSGDKTEANRDTINYTKDYWVVKIDSSGNKIWDKRFGGYYDDYLFAVIQTDDYGYLLGGESYSGAGGDKTEANWDTIINNSTDYWVVKIDSLGNKVWDRRFGGTESDELFSLIQNHNGEFILGGCSRSAKNGDITESNWDVTNTSYDYWVLKLDSLGIKIWDYRYGGDKSDILVGMQQSANNEYFLLGYSQSGISGNKSQQNWDPSNSTTDYWIVKIDSSGSLIWDKRFGGSSTDWGRSIQYTKQNQLIIGGDSYSNIGGDKSENNLGVCQSWIIKIDTSGNKYWDKTIQTSGYNQSTTIFQTNDGCFAMANYNMSGVGGEKTQPSQGSADYWIIKYCDTTQAVVFVPNTAFFSSDTAFCDKQIIDFTDISTNSPTTWQWYFPGAVPSFDSVQNPTGIYYNSFGSFDVTLIACNAAGCDTLFVPGLITEYQLPAVPVITIGTDTLYSTPASTYAWYNVANPSVVISIDSFYVYSQIGDYFVIVRDSIGCQNTSAIFAVTGIKQSLDNSELIKISPNPANDILNIETNPGSNLITLKIINMIGQIKYSSALTKTKEYIDISTISNGIYFVQISTPNTIITRKISINH